MECFTADFLRLFTYKRQNLAFGRTAGNSPSNPSILGIFLKFRNFVRSLVLSHLATREAARAFTLCNPGQSIWHKVKKYSKTGQEYKNLISNFACFLTAFVRV